MDSETRTATARESSALPKHLQGRQLLPTDDKAVASPSGQKQCASTAKLVAKALAMTISLGTATFLCACGPDYPRSDPDRSNGGELPFGGRGGSGGTMTATGGSGGYGGSAGGGEAGQGGTPEVPCFGSCLIRSVNIVISDLEVVGDRVIWTEVSGDLKAATIYATEESTLAWGTGSSFGTDTTYAYHVKDQSLQRTAIVGGGSDQLASNIPDDAKVATGLNYVFLKYIGDIWRVPKQGGAAELIATSTGIYQPSMVDAYDDMFFWGAPEGFWRIDADGSNMTNYSLTGAVDGFDVNAAYLYYPTSSTIGRQAHVSPGYTEVICDLTTINRDVALTSNRVFWITPGKVATALHDGSNPQYTSISKPGLSGRRVAASDLAVCWTMYGSTAGTELWCKHL